MRRIVLVLTVLAVIAAACGDDDVFGTTTTGTSGGETTTTGAGSTTSPASTTEATTTTAATTTTVPGATAVSHTAYCVRGTASNDALNVRSGPGTDFDVVAELAWNAAAVPAGGFAASDQLGRPWLLVGYDGGMGWAAGWYLEPAPCGPAVIAVAPMAGPGLPDALAGGLVPWTWVDADWALALYAPDWDGPYALYLLSPFGDTYEVFAWTGETVFPFDLQDWRPDGRAVLAMVGFGISSDREIRLLDLAARTSTTVLAIPDFAFEGSAAFTRPTGRDLVVKGGDAATELVEVRRADGSLFSTLVSRPRPADWLRQATWIYGLEGTTVVVGDGDGLVLLTNGGDWIRDLDAPGEACRPVRWWDASTVLARCLAPEILASEPMSNYGRLWLVPSSGAAATALTALPPGPVDIVEFGFFDAWRIGGQVYANWAGDCGAASIDTVAADGSTTPFLRNALVGPSRGNLVVHQWDDCDQSPGSLHLVAPDGTVLRDVLVPPGPGTPGVIAALMLRDLP